MELDETEILLVHNTLNELLNGLHTARAAGLSLPPRLVLEQFYRDWNNNPNTMLAAEHKVLVTNAINVVLSELGQEDFYTRTGARIDEANRFLEKLKNENPDTILPSSPED
jgi:hypothetical protein